MYILLYSNFQQKIEVIHFSSDPNIFLTNTKITFIPKPYGMYILKADVESFDGVDESERSTLPVHIRAIERPRVDDNSSPSL